MNTIPPQLRPVLLLIAIFFGFENQVSAQAPDTLWTTLIPLPGGGGASAVYETSDRGFIVAGYGDSINGLKSKGVSDFWAIKMDSLRNIVWTKMYGGSDHEYLYTVRETRDGGFVMFGETMSVDGDVQNNHGNLDFWLLKLNANGDTVWTKNFGGGGTESASDLQLTTDGGFMVTGYSNFTDGDVPNIKGEDYWCVKLDSLGNIMWSKTYGGESYDRLPKIVVTADSGYVMGGNSSSKDVGVQGNRGSYDFWLIKTNPNGDTLWTKTIGGSSSETLTNMSVDDDGNIIAVGYSYSTNGDFINNHGGSDLSVAKLNASGNLVWSKNYGGTLHEYASAVLPVSGNSYIVLGFSNSNNGDVSGNHGQHDCWILKLDNNGNIIWSKTLGGSKEEYARPSLSQTADQGYLFICNSNSNNGDLPPGNVRGSWIVKLAPESPTCTWTGLINTYWDNPGNWSCGKVPGANDRVVINNGTVVVNSNAVVKSLKLSPSVSFSIQTGIHFAVLE